ncbi:hypothetical protein D3C80_1428190 [compost metagenome]
MHAIHAAADLEVVAPGVVADPLAHQRQPALRLGRAIAEPDDGGLVVCRSPGHRQEGAGAESGELGLIELLPLPALLLCQLLRPGPVAAGGQIGGRQHGEMTGQAIALRLGMDPGQIELARG